MSFRTFFIFIALLITGLYAVRFDRIGGVDRYAQRLSTMLDKRLINGYVNSNERARRLNHITVILHEAESKSLDLELIIGEALEKNEISPEYLAAASHCLVSNLREAEDLGLLTDENKELIATGDQPIVTRGGFLGDTAGFRPLLDYRAARSLSNNFLNMRYAATSKILSNSTKNVDREALDLAHSFFCSSLIDPNTFSSIIRRARS